MSSIFNSLIIMNTKSIIIQQITSLEELTRQLGENNINFQPSMKARLKRLGEQARQMARQIEELLL